MRWLFLAVGLSACAGEAPPDPQFVPAAWTTVSAPYDETSQACALIATQQLRMGMKVEPTATRVQRLSNTYQATHSGSPPTRVIELEAIVGQVPATWRFTCVENFNGQRFVTAVDRR